MIAAFVIYTWIFNTTRGSALIVTVFHATSNTVGTFAGTEQAFIFGFVAILIIIVIGPAHLFYQGGRILRKLARVP